jgi:hypothetical protein
MIGRSIGDIGRQWFVMTGTSAGRRMVCTMVFFLGVLALCFDDLRARSAGLGMMATAALFAVEKPRR